MKIVAGAGGEEGSREDWIYVSRITRSIGRMSGWRREKLCGAASNGSRRADALRQPYYH
jgi:hypothetical protein